MKLKKLIMLLGALTILCVGVFFSSTSYEAQAATKQYKISGQKITVIAKNKSDITSNLDAALKKAASKATDKKPMTVVVPKGTYKINSKGLHIYSNTTLDLSKGVTLKYSSKSSHPMLTSGTQGKYKGKSNYNKSSLCKGYNGFKNIKIVGGVFANSNTNTCNTMELFHAKNVTLKNVVFSGGKGVHQLEVAAINGFYVKNCTFKDFASRGKLKEKQEALQLDIPLADDVFAGIYQDGTLMKNVEITGCTFSNVPRGVGTHTLLNGAYFTNVKITKNTFKKVAEEAIVAVNYINCQIKSNKIVDCGGGIVFQFFKADPSSIATTTFGGKKAYKGKIQHNAKSVISGNTITIKYNKACDEIQGIKVYGLNLTSSKKGRDGKKIPTGNYYVSNVKVTDNTITTAGFGIHMTDTRDCVVKNNKITGKNFSSKDSNKNKYDGILVENYAKNVSVTDNTIKNMCRNGILVQKSAYVSTLTNNTITGCKRVGINFYDKSGTTGDITKNTIKNCTVNGILISTKCDIKNITSNKISLTESDAGISLYNNCTVGKINSNKITSTSSNNTVMDSGIKLTTKSTANEISGNSILASDSSRNAAGTGIQIYSNSTVKGAIKSNKIGRVKATGISLSNSATVTGSITSNTIEQSAANGIMVYNKSVLNGSVQSNTITYAKSNGISISTDATVGGNIKSNTITKSDTNGILVYTNSQVIGSVLSNTIGNVKSNGISISTNAAVGGNIDSNTVTSAEANGILVYTNSQVIGSVLSNTIGNVKSSGISISTNSTVGKGITLNIIKNAGTNGIQVYNNSAVGEDISENTISATDKGVSVSTQSTVDGIIKENTITGAKTNVNADSTSTANVA